MKETYTPQQSHHQPEPGLRLDFRQFFLKYPEPQGKVLLLRLKHATVHQDFSELPASERTELFAFYTDLQTYLHHTFIEPFSNFIPKHMITNLSTDEELKGQLHADLQLFFLHYTEEQTRELLWKLMNTVISEDFSKQPAASRAKLFTFYENLRSYLFAAYLNFELQYGPEEPDCPDCIRELPE